MRTSNIHPGNTKMNRVLLSSNSDNITMMPLNKCSHLTTMPLNKRNLLSIMDHPCDNSTVQIQGFYWPRVLLRKPVARSMGKKDQKKAVKMRRKPKYLYYCSADSLNIPTSFSDPNSLLELLRSHPAPLSENQRLATSPITGKPILKAKNRACLLMPGKPLHKKFGR